jgi:SET domain
MNHSCAPTTTLDTTKMEVRAVKSIEPGTPLTFFYPSTEWEMAQPFQCNCGAKECLGLIRGAKHIPRHILRKYYLNHHIKQLLYDSDESHKADVSKV